VKNENQVKMCGDSSSAGVLNLIVLSWCRQRAAINVYW